MADNITAEVLAELERAMRKFPTWPTDPLHALAVLGEEFGELTKDVLQLTYEPHKTSRENVRTEAIQTAAMALRFAASLDAYQYARGVQHSQDASAFGVTAPAKPPLPADATIHGKFVHYRNSSGGITTADIDAFADGVVVPVASPDLREAAKQFYNLTLADPEVIIRPPNAVKQEAITKAGQCLRIALTAGVNTPDGEQR